MASPNVDPSLDHTTYGYGNNQSYPVERLTANIHGISSARIVIPRVAIYKDLFERNLDDINETWQVLEDRPTGKTFEIAIANRGASDRFGIDAEETTFTSSLSGNKGNAVEFAENAALHPNRQRLFITPPGNGKSSYWDLSERNYIKRTGRFIDGRGRPLPTIEALERVLRWNDLTITRASTNSAGGAYFTALMKALPEGQMTHAYIKSRPNISDHGHLGSLSRLLWGLGVMAADIRDDSRFKAASNDPWKLENVIDEAVERLPQLYSDDQTINRARTVQEEQKTFALGKLWTDMIALSRGGVAGDRFKGAAADTRWALRKQPALRLTYHIPLNDRLYRSRKDIELFLSRTASVGHWSGATLRDVQLLLVPGAHRDHTSYPTMRGSMESYAFRRED